MGLYRNCINNNANIIFNVKIKNNIKRVKARIKLLLIFIKKK